MKIRRFVNQSYGARCAFCFLTFIYASNFSNRNKSFGVMGAAWFIAPPTQQQDWQQLASLISKSWYTNSETQKKDTLFAPFRNMLNERRVEQETYRHYVKTARRMRGSKYSLLVAKEWGTIVGVIEMGMQQYKPTTGGKEIESLATIGMICVDPNYRGQRIASALVDKCEELSLSLWNETIICADVEPKNEAASNLFQSRGYTVMAESVIVAVRGPGGLQERQHIRLVKSFAADADERSQHILKTDDRASNPA